VSTVWGQLTYFGTTQPLSFVKIDVEGAEHRVLVGMARILAEQRPFVLVEIHDHRPDHPALSVLSEADYEIARVGDTKIADSLPCEAEELTRSL